MYNNFTKEDTIFCKGIALCMLLLVHLFYQHPEFGIFYRIRHITVVCVAMFLILSGYGLTISAIKEFSLKNFYIKRFTQIYLNYWFIWLCFVPLGFFLHKINLQNIYGSHILLKFLLNFLGLQIFFNFYGINMTWWFVSLIIGLYILFPLLKVLVFKFNHTFMIAAFLLSLIFRQIGFSATHPISLNFMILWSFPFILGIYCAKNNLLYCVKNAFSSHRIVKFIVYSFFIILLTYIKIRADLIMSIDGLIGFLFVLLFYEYFSIFNKFKKLMVFIGEHAFNIFLFHTFIYYYYFSNGIYSFNNPILIYLVLLAVCLLISLFLNLIKSSFGKIYKLLCVNIKNGEIIWKSFQ